MHGARVAPFVMVALAGAGASACGDNIRPSTNGVRSGDRLKAIFAAAEDARIFLGFYDEVRRERCQFQLLPDQERAICIAATAATTATIFADDECTLPMMPSYEVPDGQLPRLARVDSTGCEPPTLWQLGDAVTPGQFYSRTALGGCAWHAALPSEVFYPAVARVELDDFAGGQARVADGGTTLHERYIDGDDGSRQPIGMYDEGIGAPCRFTEELSFGLRVDLGCYPEICTTANDQYLDESCRPLVPFPFDSMNIPVGCLCSPRRFAVVLPSDPGGRHEVREIGEELTPPIEVYVELEDSCALTGFLPDPWSRTRGTIEAITGTRAVAPGIGRLRSMVIEADGVTSVEPWLRDTELSLRCEPRLAGDGLLRCLPSGLTQLTDGFFSDDQCTQPVRVADDQLLDGPARWAIVDEFGRRTVYQLTREAIPGSLFTGGPGIGCASHFWSREFQRFYIVGPEATPDRFAAMVEVVE